MSKYQFVIKPGDFKAWLNEIQKLVNHINNPKGKKSRYNFLELKIKGSSRDEHSDSEFGSSYSRIPDGNYYLKYYYNGLPQTVINLYHNEIGEFVSQGKHPLFFLEKAYLCAKETKVIQLYTVAHIMRMAIHDRMNQIAYATNRDTLPVKYTLLDNTCAAVLRFKERNHSTTIAHDFKVTDRMVFLSANRDADGQLKNSGSWLFDPINNNRGSFTDVFTNGVMDTDQLRDIIDEIGIVLGIGTETPGTKGSYVVSSHEIYLARLHYNHSNETSFIDPKFRHHSDILINETPFGISSMYENAQKSYTRQKSLNYANICEFVDNKIKVEHPSLNFWRNHCYLSKDPNEIGKIDQLDQKTTFNAIVVFVEGDDAPHKHLNPEMKDIEAFNADDIQNATDYFEIMNKEELSNYAHMADCHVGISQELAQTKVILHRTMKLDIPESAFTIDFHKIFNRVKEFGPINLDNNPDGFTINTHLAYKVECDQCQNFMSPGKVINNEDTKTYQTVECATFAHQHWVCNCCFATKSFELAAVESGRVFMDNSIAPITIANYYPGVKSAVIHDIDMDLIDESGVPIFLDIYGDVNMARVVSPEGVKGFTIPMGQEFLGKLDLVMIDPLTGQENKIDNLLVDMIVPYGAFKGKNTGMGLAFERFANMSLGLQLCPDKQLDPIDGDIDAFMQRVNAIYDSSHIAYTAKVFNPKTRTFELKTITNKDKKIRFGIVNLGVTELNSEFFKVLNEYTPMKVSPMNTISYNVMGLYELDEVLRSGSYESLENSDKFSEFENTLRAYSSDPSQEYKVLKAIDIRKPPVLMLGNAIRKIDWLNFIKTHQLFVDKELEDGVCIKVKDENDIEFDFVIPPRKALFKMLNQSFGHKVLLSETLLKIIELWRIIADSPEKIDSDFIKRYRFGLLNTMRGKTGLLAKASTYVVDGVQGKSIASGFIPENTVVIGSERFWKTIHRKSVHCDVPYEEFIRRLSLPEEEHQSIQVYGTTQRDPFIWFVQALNGTRIWHPHRANRHFKHKYNIGFFEMYPLFEGIIVNVVDALYKFQSDSDGDLFRITVPLEFDIQEKLAELVNSMQNYSLLFDKSNSKINKIYQMVKWWHLKYFLKETEGNTSRGWKNEYEMKIINIPVTHTNKAYLDAVQAKKSIGPITVSAWQIFQISNYLYETKQITEDHFLAINTFYQTAVVQDGSIRSVKHVSGALNRLSIDEIAQNSHMIKDIDGKEYTAIQKVHQLIELYGYSPEIIKAFDKVVEFWMANGQVIDGKMAIDQSTKLGMLIRSMCVFLYGTKAGLGKNRDIFESFRIDEVKNTFIYKIHQNVIRFINTINDKLYIQLTFADEIKKSKKNSKF